VVSLAAVGFLVHVLREVRERAVFLGTAVGLILGGALGNLKDRILTGEVVDFLDVYMRDLHWPAFNVADSAITIGMILLLIFYPGREKKG
jgi:signal peptidase II